MAGRRVGKLHALILVLMLAGLTACTPGAPDLGAAAVAHDLQGEAIVTVTDDVAVAARASGSSVEVLQLTRRDGGWHGDVVASADADNAATTSLVGVELSDGLVMSLFFGTAPESVSRVELIDEREERANVIDGAWVIPIVGEVRPDMLTWQMVDPFGAVIEAGTGLFP